MSSSNSSKDKKPVSAPEVVSMMSKITEDKLISLNYLNWSKTIRFYLRSIHMASHLSKDSPTNDSKDRWLEDDAHLFLQIRNSINGKVLTLINHCEYVKKLMEYLEFVYSGKRNISRIFDVCRAFYRTEKQDRSLTELFMDYKKTYEELNPLLPFSPDVKVQQSQREQMVVMRFLAALPSEYESIKAQILSSLEISSFQETFTRILCTETSSSTPPSAQMSSALVSWNMGESEKQQYRSGGPDDNSRGTSSRGIVCYYCHKPGHVIRDCKKRQSRNQRVQSAHVTSTNEASGQSVQFTAEELARFHVYQESLKSPSTSITALAKSGNSNKCLASSSSSE